METIKWKKITEYTYFDDNYNVTIQHENLTGIIQSILYKLEFKNKQDRTILLNSIFTIKKGIT